CRAGVWSGRAGVTIRRRREHRQEAGDRRVGAAEVCEHGADCTELGAAHADDRRVDTAQVVAGAATVLTHELRALRLSLRRWHACGAAHHLRAALLHGRIGTAHARRLDPDHRADHAERIGAGGRRTLEAATWIVLARLCGVTGDVHHGLCAPRG